MSNTTAVRSLQKVHDWLSLQANLLVYADCLRSLYSILEEEIEMHDGSTWANKVRGFCKASGVPQTRVVEFLDKKVAMTGEGSLTSFVKYSAQRHPNLFTLVKLTMETKEALPKCFGPVALRSDDTINSWISLMQKLSTVQPDKRIVSANFGMHSQTIYNVLTPKPSAEAMKVFENNLESINLIIEKLDWEAVRISKKKFRSARRIKGKKSKPKVRISNIKDSRMPNHINDEHWNFVEIANKCLTKFGMQKTVIAKCQEVGIPIGRTSFNVAYNKGQIADAAKSFIKLAPKLLLQEVTAQKSSHSPSSEGVTEGLGSASLNSENYIPHDLPVGQSENFVLNLKAQLLSTAQWLKVAVQASAEQRDLIVKECGGALQQIETDIQAVKAADPFDILQMFSGKSSGTPNAQRKGRRGHRT